MFESELKTIEPYGCGRHCVRTIWNQLALIVEIYIFPSFELKKLNDIDLSWKKTETIRLKLWRVGSRLEEVIIVFTLDVLPVYLYSVLVEYDPNDMAIKETKELSHV